MSQCATSCAAVSPFAVGMLLFVSVCVCVCLCVSVCVCARERILFSSPRVPFHLCLNLTHICSITNNIHN